MIDDFEQQPVPDLQWVRQSIHDLEFAISNKALDLELSAGLADLHRSPAWQNVVARLKRVVDGETHKLRSERMDPYEFGRRQGLLGALALMTRDEPLKPAEVDKLAEDIRLSQIQLDQLRPLLL